MSAKPSPLPSERCATCRFFGRMLRKDRMPTGECHRRSPDQNTATELVQIGIYRVSKPVATSWPPVWPDDWCGEYEPASLNDPTPLEVPR